MDNEEKFSPVLEKKRFGRRAFFAVLAIALITIFAYIVLLTIEDPAIGLKWVIFYSIAIGLIACIAGGLLTVTDVKTLAESGLKMKNIK